MAYLIPAAGACPDTHAGLDAPHAGLDAQQWDRKLESLPPLRRTPPTHADTSASSRRVRAH